MTELLTQRQDGILRFAVQFLLINGYPPTVREIGREFGIRSTNGVQDHLRALVRKGYINNLTNLARGLSFTRKAFVAVPHPPNAMLRYVLPTVRSAGGERR
jgi:repressor LexA